MLVLSRASIPGSKPSVKLFLVAVQPTTLKPFANGRMPVWPAAALVLMKVLRSGRSESVHGGDKGDQCRQDGHFPGPGYPCLEWP